MYPTDQPRDQDPARNVESSSCIMLVETDGHNVLLSYTVESVFFLCQVGRVATNRDTLYRRSTLRLTLLTDRPAIGGCGLIPSPAAPRNTRKCFFFILFNGRSLFEPFSLAVPLHKGCKNSPLVRSMMIAWPSYLYPNGLYIFVRSCIVKTEKVLMRPQNNASYVRPYVRTRRSCSGVEGVLCREGRVAA